MASPDVFLSSPSRERRRVYQTISSSPDLPSIQELASQKPRRPPIRSGSKAAPIPDDAPTTFTSAGSLWRSLQAADAVAKSSSAARAPTPEEVEEIEAPVVIEKPTKAAPKTRRPRRQKQPKPVVDVAATTQSKVLESPKDDQPWRKFKSPSKERASPTRNDLPQPESDGVTVTEGQSKTSPFFATSRDTEVAELEPVAEVEDKIPNAIEGSVGGERTEGRCEELQMATTPKPKARSKARTVADHEPLQLEQAMSRRTDWTPPAKTAHIILDSDGPSLEDAHHPHHDSPKDIAFGHMLATFKCEDTAQNSATSTSGEESGFVKKRKLLEFVSAKVSNVSEPDLPVASPIKQKAPKKKPRTITALATAAYRTPTQPDPQNVTEAKADAEPPKADAANGKGKAKARKRAPKPSKKKAPLPKPILLSPGTALKQVAGQNFVFGTSSQLAREHSPSLLRDIQTAMKSSNQLDHPGFATPLNSDDVDPAEKRQPLWNAAARDADGDLFDVEVLNLVHGSQRLADAAAEEDPFGYIKGDEGEVDLPPLPLPPSESRAVEDDSFLTLSDILPAPAKLPAEPVDIAPASSSQPIDATAATDAAPVHVQAGSVTQAADQTMSTAARSEPAERPSYDHLSDAQLAKQVAQYGFKPIKKRAAMVALLEQCWRPGVHGQVGGTRSASTTSKGSTGIATTTAAPTTPDKRGRGRPRKASVVEEPMQEPPPSAQPQESPKRRRGRPKKDSGSVCSGAAAGRAKAGPSTPKRSLKKPVIEIPDSEGDGGGESSETPWSSPDATFSPPQPGDITLSVDEDTELSLTFSPTDQQTELFSYVTKAVTTAPRTTDPANPSWHEKILLYDPIVIEDLTAWLNAGQLTRVGCDEEVSSGAVKTWCESKSICCLWKVNLRGKERKRY